MSTPQKDCIFCRIIAGEIPSEKIYEDKHCLAFKDIKPIAPTHVLVVPKAHHGSLQEIPSEQLPMMAHLFDAVQKVAQVTGVLETGYRTIINTGRNAGQIVFHLHVHVIGGKPLGAMG